MQEKKYDFNIYPKIASLVEFIEIWRCFQKKPTSAFCNFRICF